MSESEDPAAAGSAAKRRAPLWQRLLPWVITLACFAYLYNRIGAQTPPGQSVPGYLAEVFATVNWLAWLALMIPYSFIYLLIDTAVLWRVINWFNAPVLYRDILPIRGSSYILSILNEGRRSALLKEDPNGTSALMQVRVRRREARKLKRGGLCVRHRVAETSRGLAPRPLQTWPQKPRPEPALAAV